MKLKNLLKIFLATVLTTSVLNAQSTFKCLQEFTINALNEDGDIFSCAGADIVDILELRSSSYATPIGYLVTNENDIIVKFSLRSFLNVDDLPAGNYKIYGFSFLGTPTLKTGMPLNDTELANICYELSDNFIRLFNVDPDGQSIATDDGSSSIFVCSQDGNADIINFMTTSLDPNYAYLVTDEQGIIQDVITNNSFDFEGKPFGPLRVYGLSFVGDLLAEPGQSIFSDQLSVECFDLSDNFVDIIATEPVGGQVQLPTGETETVVCTGDGEDDILSFNVQNNSNAPYQFVLTDSINRVLLVLGENELNFDFLAPGTCRIWGVSFTGNLDIAIDENITTQALSDDCFDLSDNFIAITKKNPTGGNVSLPDGVTETLLCINDENPDVLTFLNTGGVNESYAYIVTDTNNVITELIDGEDKDFEGTAAGNFRVWGLGFTGNFTGQIGEVITTAALSDECFELSQNFIQITSVFIDPGSITLTSGATDTVLCFGDPNADILSFQYTTQTSANIRYVLTDGQDSILSISTSNTFDFAGNTLAECKVYGLSFSGDLLVAAGDNIQTTILSTECFDITDEPVLIQHTFIEGGSISLADNTNSRTICVQDGSEDLLRFVANDAIETQYAYIITDEDNIITAVAPGNSFDFDMEEGGTALVYGVSFSGNLSATVGENINEISLATECFDLSDNFITLTKRFLEAGSISLLSGNQDTIICFGDPQADRLRFDVEGFNRVGDYRYLLTDADDNILAIFDRPVFNFEDITVDECKVFGLSFTGDLLAGVGDNAFNTVFSTECFDLTDDFVAIRHIFVEGGTVSLADGSTELVVCVQNGAADLLEFTAQNALEEQYTYIITDETGTITDILASNTFDFEPSPAGLSLVYGVSFSGNLTAQVGDNIDGQLASECFDLSDEPIVITKKLLEAGSVSLLSGNRDTTICFGDPMEDRLEFAVSGFNNVGDFRFVLTDNQDNILAIFTMPMFNFNDITIARCRVQGISFTGDFLAEVGDNLNTTVLASECYDVTDEFVDIRHVFVEGGLVTLADQSTERTICVQDGVEDLIAFQGTMAITEQYAFILTDENNIITSVLDSSSFNFDNEVPGTAFVYGLSYSGTLTAQVGQDINAANLASECFDISSNVVELTKKQLEAGLISLTSGAQDTFICFGNPEEDILNFEINGFNNTGTLSYVLTDRQNTVLAIFDTPQFNFTEVLEDQCRVFGISYTGDLTLQNGDNLNNAIISTECYDITDNSVTVEHIFVDGAELELTDNSAGTTICAADGIPDIIEVVNNSTSDASYQYVLTDENNRIILVLEGNSINLDIANAGICRIWGVSFTGSLEAEVGQILTEEVSSETCFDLSDNFIEITKKDLIPGNVTLTNGATETAICAGEGVRETVRFTNTSPQKDEDFAYVITDESNTVLSISNDSTVVFSNITIPGCRVWGVIYSGDLLLRPGDQILSSVISTECFEVTNNFVAVRHKIVEGAMVSLSDGLLRKNICVQDGTPDPLELTSSSTSNERYAYLLTNERNQLLNILPGNSVDLDGTIGGIVHIYGLSYTGNITVTFGANVTQSVLTDDCFDLSDNFVEINKIDLQAGTVSLINGLQNTFVCFGDAVEDRLQFTNTSAGDPSYAYALTDQNDSILQLSIAPELAIQERNIPGARVYGIAYTGSLLSNASGNLFDAVLSTECTEISSNFVDIEYIFLDGGQVSLNDGRTDITVCTNDDIPDLLNFRAQTEANGAYAFILTDDNNNILLELQGSTINLDLINPGRCRIWGVSFAGELSFPIGANLLNTTLSDDCYDISDNAITIRKEQVIGGNVSFPDGSTSIFTCPDGQEDILTFNTSGITTSAYVYAITTADNEFIRFANGNAFNFERLDNEFTRVYGIAFSGQLNINEGEDITTTALSDECFSLSNNFLSITREVPEAGALASQTDEVTFDFCAGDGMANLIQLDSVNTFSGPYAYVLTDDSGEFLNPISNDEIDFDTVASGLYRIYGIAYTGNLIAFEGTLLEEERLSDDCFDLSDNFISITNDTPNVDSISTADKETLVYVCPDDNEPNLIEFFSEGQSLNHFTYLLTDEDNVVLSILPENNFDFENEVPLFTRIWGLSYAGDLLVEPGTDLDDAQLADDCFDLSDNFIRVVRDTPDAGEISTEAGVNSFRICANDGTPDVVNFTTTEDSEARYILILTDENNIIQDTLETLSTDFEVSDAGIVRVWGLSFTGNLDLQIGADIQRTMLSDDCFELTENFVEITKTEVDGGMISTIFNSDSIFVCPDNIDDIIEFNNNSDALSADYRYAITRSNGLILGYLDGNSRNFNNTAIRELRVYGISYTGNFVDNAGKGRIDEVMHSDSCFTLSNNFITIFLDVPDGGTVSTADGASSVDFCASVDDPFLELSKDNNSFAGYAYLLTDTADQIIRVSTADAINLGDVERGTYRVYGLSYTGMLTAAEGQSIANTALASSCFDLSVNFVEVNRLGDVDGGQISLSDGSDVLFSCPGDAEPDLAVLMSNSTLQNENYRYIITDMNDRIQITDIRGEVIDFNPAPPRVFRIYAVSFTGDFTPQVGRDINSSELSSECFEISENFITVFNEGPMGGTVTLADGSQADTIAIADPLVEMTNTDGVGAMYAYVITDEDNSIIDATFEQEVDFSALSAGTYRVYGLALNGNYTGLTGADIFTATLSDACFGLSDNSVSITLAEQVEIVDNNDSEVEEAQEQAQSADLRLWPNPVRNSLGIEWHSDFRGDIKFVVFDVFGKEVISRVSVGGAEEVLTTISVDQLNTGIYLLVTIKDGRVLAKEKFIKSE